MNVDLYERIWMWASGVILAMFLGAILIPAATAGIHPSSHVETVDPTTLATHPEFGTGGVTANSDGSVVVSVAASMFSFSPDPIEVPAGRPITFRITSSDVIHGFQVVGTNVNTMAVPGYVSKTTVTFDKPGQYAITCHEYCGVFHHEMVGTLVVK
jgi:cytochrome c oxidase subunit II